MNYKLQDLVFFLILGQALYFADLLSLSITKFQNTSSYHQQGLGGRKSFFSLTLGHYTLIKQLTVGNLFLKIKDKNIFIERTQTGNRYTKNLLKYFQTG